MGKTPIVIPKILHFMWYEKPITDWARFIITMWELMNPDFKIMVHIKEWESVHESHRDAFRRTKKLIDRVDVCRWGILKMFGGWVIDADIIPLRPFDTIYNEIKTDFIATEYYQDHNCLDVMFVGASAISPVWRYLDNYLTAHRYTGFNPFGFNAINFAYKNIPNEFTVLKQQMFCQYGRHDMEEVRLGIKFLENLMLGKNTMDYINHIREKIGYLPYGVHLWTGGKRTLRLDAFNA